MTYSSVIIASTAGYLINTLRELLSDFNIRVFSVSSDDELKPKINTVKPRMIFIENCFSKPETDSYIYKLSKANRDIRLIVWSLCEVSLIGAARLINADADSFFSLREKEEKITSIIYKIVGGQSYCPDDVKAVLDKDNAVPIFGKKLTRREVQIMRMSFKYKTNQKMADALCLSRAAVRFHKANIYKKCGGETPVDILCNGIIKGIILPEDLE
jgi:DNA-binding NarL/FixJ family response regulator